MEYKTFKVKLKYSGFSKIGALKIFQVYSILPKAVHLDACTPHPKHSLLLLRYVQLF